MNSTKTTALLITALAGTAGLCLGGNARSAAGFHLEPDPGGDKGGGTVEANDVLTLDAAAEARIVDGVLAKIGPAMEKATENAVSKTVPKVLEEQSKAAASRKGRIDMAAALFPGCAEAAKAATEVLGDGALTIEAAVGKVMDAGMKHHKPLGGGHIEFGATQDEKTRAAHELRLTAEALGSQTVSKLCGAHTEAEKPLVAAALGRLGFADSAALSKALSDVNGSGLGSMRLVDLARASIRGDRKFQNQDQMFAAAFSLATSDFPELTSNVMNKTALAVFELTPTTYEKFCKIGSNKDFKQTKQVQLSNSGRLKRGSEGGTPRELTVNERKFTTQVETWDASLSLTRELIIGDDLSSLTGIAQQVGRAARLEPQYEVFNKLVANATMADGVAYFATARGNLLSGAITLAKLKEAFTKLRTMKDFGPTKEYITVTPKYVLVPEALFFQVEGYRLAELDPDTTTTLNAPNTLRGSFETIADPRLDAKSATGWYVVGTGAHAPFIVSFLNGRREPIINAIGDGSIRGVKYEIVFDFGVDASTPESMTYSPGT